ncbi:hypothetical protein C2S52_010550 [Perilla frutescens var. hirtella]|nr:hypothetical protein C2S52_010550 [Perilla frutescens var. hirtella]KAH6817384.1 hypothetical protein C2S51_000987 [Perilla frutescens var. frutescens]
MGDNYAECHKPQKHLDGKTDGCQHFFNPYGMFDCMGCGCHVSFHRKVVKCRKEVVYTKCNKIHTFGSQASVDGCQEFAPKGRKATPDALICSLCGCDKAFHRNEITVQLPSTP